MKYEEQAEAIIEALLTLDDTERSLFLACLTGVVKFDSPKSIVDAVQWSSVREKIEKALDARS